MKEKKVCWLSAGVSSFISGYLVKDSIDEFIYIDIKDQHDDSLRFIKDCEKVLNKPINIIKSSEFDSVEDVVRKFKIINTPYGAPCTGMLKKKVRKVYENKNSDFHLTYVWGFDVDEEKRAKNIVINFPEFNHEFPLIDFNLTKQDCHAILDRLGIKRPVMYDLGYSNNNCIGCVKGGKGYWNKIRKDFPDVFRSRCLLEREIGSSCINGIYLDELPEYSGRESKEILQDCSVMCFLALDELR